MEFRSVGGPWRDKKTSEMLHDGCPLPGTHPRNWRAWLQRDDPFRSGGSITVGLLTSQFHLRIGSSRATLSHARYLVNLVNPVLTLFSRVAKSGLDPDGLRSKLVSADHERTISRKLTGLTRLTRGLSFKHSCASREFGM